MADKNTAVQTLKPTFPWRLMDWMNLPEWFEETPLRVEEFREGDEYVVRAEMPGIDPDQDVDLDVTDDVLRIKAHRRQESSTQEKTGYRSEFNYGSFVRIVPLSHGLSRDDVKATYRDGILEIRVPVDQGKVEGDKVPVTRL